jgi:hypothetical protein
MTYVKCAVELIPSVLEIIQIYSLSEEAGIWKENQSISIYARYLFGKYVLEMIN